MEDGYGEGEARANGINALFEALAFRAGIRHWELFRRAYAELGLGSKEQSYQELGGVLGDVRACPPPVLAYAEMLLKRTHEAEMKRRTEEGDAPPAERAVCPLCGVPESERSR